MVRQSDLPSWPMPRRVSRRRVFLVRSWGGRALAGAGGRGRAAGQASRTFSLKVSLESGAVFAILYRGAPYRPTGLG